MKLKREIRFIPGFDFIVNGPPEKAKYGRHCMEIYFVLKGLEGAVTFKMFTGWMPMVEDGIGWKPTHEMPSNDFNPMAVDIGYHSPKPLHDYQKEYGPAQEKCEWIKKPCYYDGSALGAERYMAKFLNEGEEALWKMMEEYYNDIFEIK